MSYISYINYNIYVYIYILIIPQIRFRQEHRRTHWSQGGHRARRGRRLQESGWMDKNGVLTSKDTQQTYQQIWVNYNDRALESWFLKGNHPKMAELFR